MQFFNITRILIKLKILPLKSEINISAYRKRGKGKGREIRTVEEYYFGGTSIILNFFFRTLRFNTSFRHLLQLYRFLYDIFVIFGTVLNLQ